MQVSAGSHFMGLLFAFPSGCQSKRSYKAVIVQRIQSFPGNADHEILSLLQVSIQQLVFLYIMTNRNLYMSLYRLLP